MTSSQFVVYLEYSSHMNESPHMEVDSEEFPLSTVLWMIEDIRSELFMTIIHNSLFSIEHCVSSLIIYELSSLASLTLFTKTD